LCTIGRICNRCTGCVATATLWKCVAKPSGNPSGPPHAARSATHYASRLRLTPLAGDNIDAPAACAVPFRPYYGGVITRTRNVSQYMLVLALCPVSHCCWCNRKGILPVKPVPMVKKSLLEIKILTTNTTTRPTAFCGPAIWNSLPPAVHDNSLLLNTFNHKLKTHRSCCTTFHSVYKFLSPPLSF